MTDVLRHTLNAKPPGCQEKEEKKWQESKSKMMMIKEQEGNVFSQWTETILFFKIPQRFDLLQGA